MLIAEGRHLFLAGLIFFFFWWGEALVTIILFSTLIALKSRKRDEPVCGGQGQEALLQFNIKRI